MTEQEQRVAIAEFCGWKWHHHPTVLGSWINPADGRHDELPDYCGDLNAIAEAEEKLEFLSGQKDDYHSNLQDVVAKSNDPLPASQCRGTYRATAGQRAEALLRTIGKWKD